MPYTKIIHGPPDKYQQGMFLDIFYTGIKVHSYQEMREKMEQIQNNYPDDAKIFTAGRTQGFRGTQNSLDILGIHIKATQKPKKTLFFVAGHHPEFSGPETALSILESLITSYHAGNTYVKSLRKNTHIVVIPQINVDLYNNLDIYCNLVVDETNPIMDNRRKEFHKIGYGTTKITILGTTTEEPNRADTNFYGHRRESISNTGLPPAIENRTVKAEIERIIIEYGKPFLSFDYHEYRAEQSKIIQMSLEGKPLKGDGELFIDSDEPYIETQSLPTYALKEVDKEFPCKIVIDDEEVIDKNRWYTFNEFMASKGAESFLFEQCKYFNLEGRVRMNLLGTDRILARYFLGI